MSHRLSMFITVLLVGLFFEPVQLNPNLANQAPDFSAQEVQESQIGTLGFVPYQVLISYIVETLSYNKPYSTNYNPYDQRSYGKDYTKTEFLCTGVILNSTTVLVAANCTFTSNGKSRALNGYRVRTGLGSLSNETNVAANSYQVGQIIVNPDYEFSESSDDNDDNNVALLLLTQEIQFSPFVSSACLDLNTLIYPELYISGYGIIPILDFGTRLHLKYAYGHESLRSDCKNVTEICVYPGLDPGYLVSCSSTLGAVLSSLEFDVIGIVPPNPNTNDPCSQRIRAIRLAPYKEFLDENIGERSYCHKHLV